MKTATMTAADRTAILDRIVDRARALDAYAGDYAGAIRLAVREFCRDEPDAVSDFAASSAADYASRDQDAPADLYAVRARHAAPSGRVDDPIDVPF